MKMNLVLGKYSKNVSYGLFVFGGKYRINYYISYSYSKFLISCGVKDVKLIIAKRFQENWIASGIENLLFTS